MGGIGIDTYILLILCINWITNENMMYRTENCYLMHYVDIDGKEVQTGGAICKHIADSFCFSRN